MRLCDTIKNPNKDAADSLSEFYATNKIAEDHGRRCGVFSRKLLSKEEYRRFHEFKKLFKEIDIVESRCRERK